jgi:hypothetical protein
VQLIAARPFASKKKPRPKAKKTKTSAAPTSSRTSTPSSPADSASHQEWVKFQNSIAVEGFETGQTMVVSTGAKKRGGKAARNKTRGQTELEDKLKERRRLTEAGGGQYPPMRYEDAETERLLAEAYAAIPARAGKRGTRSLKRQKKRWHLVKQIHSKYKYHMANFQERKMEKRKQRMESVREVLDVAPSVRELDRAYQAKVFQRWAATMVRDQGEGEGLEALTAELSTGEGRNKQSI